MRFKTKFYHLDTVLAGSMLVFRMVSSKKRALLPWKVQIPRMNRPNPCGFLSMPLPTWLTRHITENHCWQYFPIKEAFIFAKNYIFLRYGQWSTHYQSISDPHSLLIDLIILNHHSPLLTISSHAYEQLLAHAYTFTTVNNHRIVIAHNYPSWYNHLSIVDHHY